MNTDYMTPQELRELADKKEIISKIRKIGFLKEDIYEFDFRGLDYEDCEFGYDNLCTLKQKDEMINYFLKSFKVVIQKGTKFNCYIDKQEEWYDDVNYGIEMKSKEWAEKHLENIQEV